jgi:oligopeptide/dipeptide ABC transporter ATP-binding protein
MSQDTLSSPATENRTTAPLLETKNLRKDYKLSGGMFGSGKEIVRAVDDVSFAVKPGETFGLVGESGCGKSTIARCIVRLLRPSAGKVIFDGADVGALGTTALRNFRRRVQIVFQDPFASLDPRMSARAIVEEPLQVHNIGDHAEQRQRAMEVLSLVGLVPEQARRKPHEFSGGQQQRIGLARALVLNPDMLVLDEPVSALDVSIQAQVLNFLREIQDRLALTYLFIAHDLAVAEYFCDRLAVLYLGSVAEMADSVTLFKKPLHPYTVALLSAVPIPDPASQRRRNRIVLTGEVSPVASTIVGCPFRPRCPVGRDRDVCHDQRPPLAEVEPGHQVACHFPGHLESSGRVREIAT